jgi:CDGSH-type Zn-finger protein
VEAAKFQSAGSKGENGMASTKVTVNSNGSLRIEGDFEIVDPTGKAFGLAGRTTIGLCRCGQSANKPFCDGSHGRVGFSDPVAARDLPPPKPKV